MGQRLRITFSRRDGVKYLSHLELMRLWERAFRRAGWRLAHSQGFNPHPKISFAAPLPVGVAGERELVDVILEQPRAVADAAGELGAQMPPGIEVASVEPIPEVAPPIQRLLRAAEYLAVCHFGQVSDPEAQVARILSATELPRDRVREGKTQRYDLRPMIRRLEATVDGEGRPEVMMELRVDAQGAGRPDEVLREMGFDPADCAITRLRLLLEGEPQERGSISDG